MRRAFALGSIALVGSMNGAIACGSFESAPGPQKDDAAIGDATVEVAEASPNLESESGASDAGADACVTAAKVFSAPALTGPGGGPLGTNVCFTGGALPAFIQAGNNYDFAAGRVSGCVLADFGSAVAAKRVRVVAKTAQSAIGCAFTCSMSACNGTTSAHIFRAADGPADAASYESLNRSIGVSNQTFLLSTTAATTRYVLVCRANQTGEMLEVDAVEALCE